MKKIWIVYYSMFFLSFGVFAQDDKAILRELLEEDNRAIEALVLYPKSTRTIILETASHPEALIRINAIREKTQVKFREIIAPFNQKGQDQFYDVTRFPKLLGFLTEGDQKKSKGEIEEMLKEFPEEVHESTQKIGRKRYNELVEIQALYHSAEEAFKATTQMYPPTIQGHFEKLVGMPEVLDILMENFQSTVLIGSIHDRDPDWVWQMSDSIQEEVAQKKGAELMDWKENLEKDSEAMKELENAAENFAEENGYDSRTYRAPISEADFYSQSGLYYRPYSYWLGYPWWYSHPIWYSRPYWYDWGFYYGPGGALVIVDFPSWYFLDWYFTRSYHHYYYPHLTHRYLTHYERHRTSTLSSTSRIRNWNNQHRNTYSRDWLKNDQKRVDRIRDFGRQNYIPPNREVPTSRSPTQTRPNPPVRTLSPTDKRTPIINRAPEYHNQQLKSRTPVRVSPTTPTRKPANINRVPSTRNPSTAPRKRN